MKIAVIGSRNLNIKNIEDYISQCDEIVTGGAIGIDSCAKEYAKRKGIKLTEFLPEYNLYGRTAPIVRNKKIVDYADKVIAIWDGNSKGTLSVIKYAQKTKKACEIFICS